MTVRPTISLGQAKWTLEGAGVHLHRAFGFGDTTAFDPFLLLDDFSNYMPGDYLAGFPWHPHRGIETITYVLAGTVAHEDSLGNRGVIGWGDVQWMTAGRGIIHQEMPKGDPAGRLLGFQLWTNLPASHKMMPPRYQGVSAAEIPMVTDDDGTEVRVVCGAYRGTTGPVDSVAAEPIYLDVSVPAKARKAFPVEAARTAFAYVFAGTGGFGEGMGPPEVSSDPVVLADAKPHAQAGNRSLVRFGAGDEVVVEAGDAGVRFLLVSGLPIGEPVAWHGPIVMNTQEELRRAFVELQAGTFLG